MVAPRKGAWIETLMCAIYSTCGGNVAPRKGAWIETISASKTTAGVSASRLARARGLKRLSNCRMCF